VVSGFSFSRLGLVGAVGIELLFHFTKSRVFTVLPTASQMNWSQMELTKMKALRNSYEKRTVVEHFIANRCQSLI